MKQNRLCVFLILISLCMVLCSCRSNFIYENCAQTNFNYNNISAGISPYWIDDNGVYFMQHNLGFDVCKIDQNGKTKIATISEPSSDIQVYGNNLYYFESEINQYVFIQYDLVDAQKECIATVNTERIYDYFLLDNSLFVVEGCDEDFIKSISSISLDNGEKKEIAHDIFAYGIINNTVHYLSKEDHTYSVCKYNSSSSETVILGSFELNEEYDGEVESVNFTSDTILCVQNDFEKDASIVSIYDYTARTLETCSFEGWIDEAVAFEDHAFLCVSNGVGDSWTYDIYCLNIETGEKTGIQSFSEDVDLFVASDENVYVSSVGFDGIRRYSMDGNYKNILRTTS